MPRPSINLDPYHTWIKSKIQAQTPISTILTELNQVHNITVQKSTLYTYLKKHSIKPLQGYTINTPALRTRIATLYFEQGLSDLQILQYLTLKENWSLTLNGVQQIRKQLNIIRRRDPEEAERVRSHLQRFFEDEQYEENLAVGIGRNMLYVHLRQRMVDVPRDVLSDVYPVFHLDGLEHRRSKAYRRRGGWTCFGPNFMWSIDGYMKLSTYGIECYAGIDAYSRFIMWFYCGISATTARVVLAQYIKMVEQYKYIPLLMRADRGRETGLIAGAHYYLSRNSDLAQRPERPRTIPQPQHHQATLFGDRQLPIRPVQISSSSNTNSNRAILSDNGQSDLTFHECWSYGKSIHNVKIERWWGSLCEGRARFWLVSSMLYRFKHLKLIYDYRLSLSN